MKKDTNERMREKLKNFSSIEELYDFVCLVNEKQLKTIEELKKKVDNQAAVITGYQCRLFREKHLDEIGVEKRYIEVVEVDSSNSKITINPLTGRITLKISKKAPENVANKYKELVEKVKICTDFDPYTYRGTIKKVTITPAIDPYTYEWLVDKAKSMSSSYVEPEEKSIDVHQVTLQDEGKKHTVRFMVFA